MPWNFATLAVLHFFFSSLILIVPTRLPTHFSSFGTIFTTAALNRTNICSSCFSCVVSKLRGHVRFIYHVCFANCHHLPVPSAFFSLILLFSSCSLSDSSTNYPSYITVFAFSLLWSTHLSVMPPCRAHPSQLNGVTHCSRQSAVPLTPVLGLPRRYHRLPLVR